MTGTLGDGKGERDGRTGGRWGLPRVASARDDGVGLFCVTLLFKKVITCVLLQSRLLDAASWCTFKVKTSCALLSRPTMHGRANGIEHDTLLSLSPHVFYRYDCTTANLYRCFSALATVSSRVSWPPWPLSIWHLMTGSRHPPGSSMSEMGGTLI